MSLFFGFFHGGNRVTGAKMIENRKKNLKDAKDIPTYLV